MTFAFVLNVSIGLFGLTILAAAIIQEFGTVKAIKDNATKELSIKNEMDFGSSDFNVERIREGYGEENEEA